MHCPDKYVLTSAGSILPCSLPSLWIANASHPAQTTMPLTSALVAVTYFPYERSLPFATQVTRALALVTVLYGHKDGSIGSGWLHATSTSSLIIPKSISPPSTVVLMQNFGMGEHWNA